MNLNEEEFFIEGIETEDTKLVAEFVEAMESGYLDDDIEGLFGSIWKKVKKVAKSTAKNLATTYSPIVKVISAATKAIPALAPALTAINPALGTFGIGGGLIKDMMTFEKVSGKKIKVGMPALKQVSDNRYMKGYKDALEDIRSGKISVTVKGDVKVTKRGRKESRRRGGRFTSRGRRRVGE